MIGLIVFTGVAVALLRWWRAPARIWQGVGLGGLAFAVLIGITDPGARPDAAQLSGWARAIGILAILAVPVGLYVLLVRRLRTRARGETDTPTPHPTGFVQIADDAILAREVDAKLAAEDLAAGAPPPEALSVAYRAAGGNISASGQIVLAFDLAEFRRLWVEPGHRSQGLGRRLLGEMETLAAARGARTGVIDCWDWQAAGLARAAGYREAGRVDTRGGAARIWFTKELT